MPLSARHPFCSAALSLLLLLAAPAQENGVEPAPIQTPAQTTIQTETQTESLTETDPESNSAQDDFMDPRGGAISLGGEEGFGLGTAIGDPSALNGPDRDETVLDGSVRASTFSLTGHYVLRPRDNQRFIFQANVDPTF